MLDGVYADIAQLKVYKNKQNITVLKNQLPSSDVYPRLDTNLNRYFIVSIETQSKYAVC